MTRCSNSRHGINRVMKSACFSLKSMALKPVSDFRFITRKSFLLSLSTLSSLANSGQLRSGLISLLQTPDGPRCSSGHFLRSLSSLSFLLPFSCQASGCIFVSLTIELPPPYIPTYKSSRSLTFAHNSVQEFNVATQ